MSEIEDSAALPETDTTATTATAPEELPPVQPPSAGFIMQLFLIPAIIVAAVIGVWVLFGRMAGAEQDWRQLVQDLGSQNEHRRWRAASGLAHLLNADAKRHEEQIKNMSPEFAKATGVSEAISLAKNPEVGRELVKLFDSQLDSRSTRDKDITHQQFLARTLGSLDLPNTVLPSLQRATAAEYHEKVRTSALSSIALVVSRASDRGEEVNSTDLVEALIESSGDENKLIRQYSAYALGLLPTKKSMEHLGVMLSDADEKTRVNAAIAMARHDRADGFDVFADVLVDCLHKPTPAELSKLKDTDRIAALNRYQIEQPLMLKNAIRAIKNLTPKLNAKQKATAAKNLQPIAAEYELKELRKDAELLIEALK